LAQPLLSFVHLDTPGDLVGDEAGDWLTIPGDLLRDGLRANGDFGRLMVLIPGDLLRV
jgi:hypothetical protein